MEDNHYDEMLDAAIPTIAEDTLTFDDVLIVPSYSNIESRQEIDTSVSFLKYTLTTPIISSNMDFVTGVDMVRSMENFGGMGILHRFWYTEEEYLDAVKQVLAEGFEPWVSIGVRDIRYSLDLIKKFTQLGSLGGICIDVAHGYHKKVADMLEALKGNPNEEIYKLPVIAGNIATLKGAEFLQESGADGIKVGIGAGSVCTTRTVAGVGLPQCSALMECVLVKEDHPEIVVIADGGIRTSGDFAKAMATGVDAVMVGNLLAGTDEAPGELIDTEEGAFKRYRGQASFGSNGERYVKEGIEGLVPYKGPVAPILQQLRAGLQSAMSYVGARTIAEFRENAQFTKVSSHTLMENNTRVREL